MYTTTSKNKTQTPASTVLDLNKNGKQLTYIRVPYSRNSSAWGAEMIPVGLIKNGSGPTILFVGGSHGGEYEGSVSILKLLHSLNVDDVQGRIICLPALNLPAVRAGSRLSPIDNKDMNRAFPGTPNGTVTEIIAHYIHDYILPECDVVVDLHAGGASLNLAPYMSMHFLEDKTQTSNTFKALEAFGAPYGLIMQEFTGKGLLDYAVESMGKIFLCGELGGVGMLQPHYLKIAETGILNLLKHFQIIEGKPDKAKTKYLEVPTQECFIYTDNSGIYESFFPLEASISKNTDIGQIHFIDEIDRHPKILSAKQSGTLIGIRGPGRVEKGDCVGLIGLDYEFRSQK